MAAELVNAATSTNLAEMDWGKNIEICELAANDQKACREVIRALKKRLSDANSNTQLYAVTLLELLMNNIGERIQKQVIESGVLPVLVRMVASKNDSPVRERIFLLLDATQSSLGGQNGKFPEYYSAYCDLVSAGVKFPQRVQPPPSERLATQATTNRSSNPISQPNSRARSDDKPTPVPVTQSAPESSIIQKASNALEVLRDVVDAADANNPSAVKDEFTLDLVEQCSFQKQRVMHLVLTSRNEKVISQAIELNDKLQKVLDRHEAIVSGRSDVRATAVRSNHEFLNEELEEEEEQLIQRIRKGKACMMSESTQRFPQRDLYEQRIVERQSRPIIRPMTVGPPLEEPRPIIRPMAVGPPPEEPSRQQQHPQVGIPPPPSKHVERQKFFKENKVDGPAGQMKGLSLDDGRNGSDSDSSEDLILSD